MGEKINYQADASEYIEQLPRGAFLTVKSGEQQNTMTIGWGTIGYMWQRPILIVAVRYSRFTYELIDKAAEFSVSAPVDNRYNKILGKVGTESGRDIDKFKEYNIPLQPGKTIDCPVISDCGITYECKIIYRQPMDPEALNPDIRDKFYSNQDYHVIYWGEITAVYKNNL